MMPRGSATIHVLIQRATVESPASSEVVASLQLMTRAFLEANAQRAHIHHRGGHVLADVENLF
jgi:hypothetical protein